VCHRRFGKTVLCINQLIASALRCTKTRPRFAYISPYYRQSKTIAWDYLKHYCSPIPGATFNESELRVDLPNGARITLYGADNYDTLRGIYLDGVVLDEYAQMSPKAWSEVIRPALSDRLGWAIFIGTPKGHNSFYDLYQYGQNDPEWYAASFRASETEIIPKKELDAARAIMSEDEFNQEFECSFEAAIQGAYYAEQMKRAKERRVCIVDHEPDLLVHTAWDLGFDDATAIIFYQKLGKEIRIIDYAEHNGESLMFYATLLQTKGYTYGTHFLPHDAGHKQITTGKSIEEQLNELGVIGTTIVPMLGVDHGIQAVRSIFSRLFFDKDKCGLLIECLTQYHKEWDDERKVFRSKPEHDWTSHAADALRYLALGFQEEIVQDVPVYKDYSAGRLVA
jgi:phage terminase large subunit